MQSPLFGLIHNKALRRVSSTQKSKINALTEIVCWQ
jgi:hypothetical protein